MTPESVTVFLIRHGETPQHAGNRYVGRTDAPLTDRGHEQAGELARWAASADLTAVVSSTLRRARETAEPAARAAGLELTCDERLVELDFGSADGLTPEEMRERFPEARKAFEADPFTHSLPGGERPARGLTRGRAALDDIAAAHRGGRVLVVAHGTLLRLLLCDLLGIPPARYRRAFPESRNATGAALRCSGQGDWGLVAWNPPLREGADPW